MICLHAASIDLPKGFRDLLLMLMSNDLPPDWSLGQHCKLFHLTPAVEPSHSCLPKTLEFVFGKKKNSASVEGSLTQICNKYVKAQKT